MSNDEDWFAMAAALAPKITAMTVSPQRADAGTVRVITVDAYDTNTPAKALMYKLTGEDGSLPRPRQGSLHVFDVIPTEAGLDKAFEATVTNAAGVSVKASVTVLGPDGDVIPPDPPSGAYVIGDRPFASSSSWNTPVKSGARFTRLNWPTGNDWAWNLAYKDYSPGLYVSAASDPVVGVKCPDSWGWPAATRQIKIKSGVSGAAGTDGELLVADGDIVHNFWQFKRTGETTATCSAYACCNVKTDTGWGTKSPFKAAGIVAAGSSMLAGLLVPAEYNKSEIEHALHIRVDGNYIKPGMTGEAISTDGGSSGGFCQEADRLAIPPGTAEPAGLSELGKKLFRNAMKYGWFVVDKAGGCSGPRLQQNSNADADADAIWKALAKVMPLLQKVS